MSSPTSPREPTMEEILASIRRIIAEEGQSAPAKTDPSPAPPPAPAFARGGAAPPARMVPPAPPSTKALPAEDILELTDLIEEDSPPYPSKVAVPQPAVIGDPEPAPAPAASPAMWPMTPPAPASRTEEPAPATVAPAPPAAPAPEPEPEPQAAEPEAATPLAVPPLAAPAVALPPPAEVESPLLTLVAEEVVSNSMREVAEAIRAEKPVPAVTSSTPLEGLVLEALRPALKAWIDQNLPAMVERLMKDELRRLARRVENE